MGQKNCSLKAEDELTQIIGNYKVTTDIEWLNLKAEIDNRSQRSEDENSNCLDSLDAGSRESGIGEEDRELFSEMSKKDTCSSEVDSLLSEVISTTSSEVGEALLTDNITQSVDIRISPTVELISFETDDADNEFSLVADVQVKMENDVVLTNGVVHLESEDPPNDGKQNDFQEQQVGGGTLLHFEHVSVKNIKPPPTKNSKKWGVPPQSDAFSVESKIAQEIKEMKQREEDLRRMRELMAKEVATARPAQPAASNGHHAPPKETAKPKTPVPKAVNGHQNYNLASVFGGCSKRATPQKRAPQQQQQESPIEREIRMVKEREEELRRERALRMGEDDQVSLCSDSSFDSRHPSLDGGGSVCSLDSQQPSLRSPSPDSSSWSSFHKPVNMERFIASKGKQVVFKKASSDYLAAEIRPPQVKKGHQPHRKFVSAATKIQSELQEMKEREEELKKERLLGLNGQLLMSDRTPETDLNDNPTSTAICSRPDCLENDNDERPPHQNEREVEFVNQNRRRSSLIEEWERRIQKLGVQA